MSVRIPPYHTVLSTHHSWYRWKTNILRCNLLYLISTTLYPACNLECRRLWINQYITPTTYPYIILFSYPHPVWYKQLTWSWSCRPGMVPTLGELAALNSCREENFPSRLSYTFEGSPTSLGCRENSKLQVHYGTARDAASITPWLIICNKC